MSIFHIILAKQINNNDFIVIGSDNLEILFFCKHINTLKTLL